MIQLSGILTLAELEAMLPFFREQATFAMRDQEVYLLPGASDNANAMSTRQLVALIDYVVNTFKDHPDLTLEQLSGILREKFLHGRQKDWIVVSGIVEELRRETHPEYHTP